jgi:glycine/D-amino acid oxidase-like deaminating enzyme
VAGFNGHGMAMAFLCARALAELIAGRAPEHFVPEAFLPARFIAG